MNKLKELGIERWRSRSELPGAKREMPTDGFLFSASGKPYLLVSNAISHPSPDIMKLFDNFCRAVMVTYRFEMTKVSMQDTECTEVPSITCVHTEPKVVWWERLTKLVTSHSDC